MSAFTPRSSGAAVKFFLFGLIVLAILFLTALYFYRGRVSTMSADHSASPRKVADVHTIGVSLDINAERSLFLLLSADGSINRLRSGTPKNKNPDLFIGITDPAIFESVRSHLTEAMFAEALLGHTFQFQNPRGAPCKLEVRFFFKDGTSAGGFTFLYGAESEGPPSEVADFVRAAVRETEGWYQQQLRMVEKLGPQPRGLRSR